MEAVRDKQQNLNIIDYKSESSYVVEWIDNDTKKYKKRYVCYKTIGKEEAMKRIIVIREELLLSVIYKKPIKIFEDVKNSRYRVRHMITGKVTDKRFSYCKRAKELALKDAQEYLKTLSTNTI